MADPTAQVAAPAAAPAPAPQPGTSEHDAAMVARFENREGQPPAAPAKDPATPAPATEARPAWLPEKFKSAEELAKAYAELERKQAAPPKEPPKEPPKPGEPAPGEKPAGAAAVSDADFAAFTAEFAEAGSLSNETYEKLAKSGLSRAVVDSYIEGQRVLAEKYDAAGYEAAGGKEAFTAMTAWAGTNLTPAEVSAFNEATASGSVERMKLAISGLRARYEAAEGKPPALVNGGPAPTAEAYRSRAEVTAAMRDPRYKKDPAYRADVERKIAAMTNW